MSSWEYRDVLRAYRFRLYPTRAQEAVLFGLLGALRDFYNAALQERRDFYRATSKGLSYYDQAKSITEIKQWAKAHNASLDAATGECLCVYDSIHTHLLQDVLKRLDRAFQAFFRRVKLGQKPGYPRFKGRDRFSSFTFQDAGWGNGAAFVSGGARVRLSGVGNVKVKIHREMEGVLKTIGVTRDSDGHWYVVAMREIAAHPLPETEREVGIDVGLTTFAATSDGELIENPRPARTNRIRADRASRCLARRKRGSKRRRKARALLAKAYAHIANVRKDFHHKTARRIVETYDRIAVEDLNVKGLAGGMLAKAVHDAGWGQFLSILAAKAEDAGREFIAVNPSGTSQNCSACGATVAKDLSVRVHRCPCGLVLDRDVNAARNILRLGRSLRGAARA